MSVSKQDMQGARTATDLEYRHKFGKSFAEFMGIAEDARSTAQKASGTAQEAQKIANGLDQMKVFNLLTNNGKAQGLFIGEDGELYINASYVAAGILASQDGTLQIDLTDGKLKVGEVIELNRLGIAGYGRNQDTGEISQTLEIIPGTPVNSVRFPEYLAHNLSSRIVAYDTDLQLIAFTISGTSGYNYPYRNYAVRLGLDGESKIVIKDKTVSWRDNGDGTYTLIGTDTEVVE